MATVVVALCLTMAVLIFGCAPSVSTLEAFTSSSKLRENAGTRLTIITSKKSDLIERQREVRLATELVISSSRRNLISVETFYTAGYLAAAKIVFESTANKGSDILLLFVLSEKKDAREREKEVRTNLSEVVRGRCSIARILTAYYAGYLMAAEIYCYKKPPKEPPRFSSSTH